MLYEIGRLFKMIKFRIDELLEQRGKSAYWLANQIGMGHGNLWTYRKSKSNTINVQKLEAICKALECTPGDLLVIEDSKPESKKKSKSKG
jgi:putative transcriptional regulator